MKARRVMDRRICDVCGQENVAHNSDGLPYALHCRGERHREVLGKVGANVKRSLNSPEVDAVLALWVER